MIEKKFFLNLWLKFFFEKLSIYIPKCEESNFKKLLE